MPDGIKYHAQYTFDPHFLLDQYTVLFQRPVRICLLLGAEFCGNLLAR